MPLRPYQIKALESVRKHYLLGTNKQLIVMGTGTGKSVIFSNLPEYLKDILPKKTLLSVHRDELVKQAYHHFKKQNPLYNVQCETGTSSADLESADIVVASIQTLGRNNGKRALQFDYSLFDLVIIDEAHHSLSESYKRVLDALNKRFKNACSWLYSDTYARRRSRVRFYLSENRSLLPNSNGNRGGLSSRC